MYFFNGQGCGTMGWYMLIPFVIFCILCYLGFKLLSNKQTGNDAALIALNNKFVNGEISEEEYLRRKKVLRK